MRNSSLMIFLLIMPAFVLGQKQKIDPEDPEIFSVKTLTLTEKNVAPAELKLPFNSIRVIDKRFDTTKFGFTHAFFGKNVYRKATLKGGLAKGIEQYYNEYYKNSFTNNGFELVILVKRFWISDIDNSREQNLQILRGEDKSSYAYLKWEYCIAKAGQYLPVKRIDTIIKITEDLKLVSEDESQNLRVESRNVIFKEMIEINDFTKPIALFDNKNKKTLEEINAFSDKRYLLPILQTDTIPRGIYLSFEEFINNKPSIINYTKKKMKYGLNSKEVFLETPDGQTIINYWGFADEEGFKYGKYGKNKIFRIGNTFQFFVQAHYTSFDNSNPVPTKSNTVFRIPYQLDMETGLAY